MLIHSRISIRAVDETRLGNNRPELLDRVEALERVGKLLFSYRALGIDVRVRSGVSEAALALQGVTLGPVAQPVVDAVERDSTPPHSKETGSADNALDGQVDTHAFPHCSHSKVPISTTGDSARGASVTTAIKRWR